MTKTLPKKSKLSNRSNLLKEILKYKYAYLLLLPGFVLIVMFMYVPLYGLLLAFKDFNFSLGILGSPWAGFKYFEEFMGRSDFWNVFRNTLFISLGRIILEFPIPIIFAILLNEIVISKYKRFIQSVMYFPFFLSWVVMYAIIQNIFSSDGILNSIILTFGGEGVRFLTENTSWLVVLFSSSIWKTVGYNTILYLAAITKIDNQLYDAAAIDGAGRFGKIIHVTLPGMQGMILTVLILVIANSLNAGFDQIYNLMNPAVMEVADIIDTFVIREGLSRAKFSMATAAGLFKSIIALILLLTANKVSMKTRGVGLYN